MASQEETLAQQAALTQRKLEKHYTTVYKFLLDYEHSIETVQHVLVWKRPALSLVLYAFVHWIFVLQVRSSDGPISQFGNIVFWLMVADVLYRAATKENTPTETATATATATGNESGSTATSGDGSGSGASEEGSGRRWWLRRRGGGGGGGASGGQSTAMVKFEDAIMKRHTPRETGELPPYEVICLWIADILLLVDNTTLVLKHWSINEPLMFSVVLGVPGLVLALLGRYIPTLVLLYIVVMLLLTCPYIEHHNLRVRVVALAQAHYPGILRRAKAAFNFLRKLVLSRNKEESPEFSLSEGGDEARTEQALQEAFDQATGQQNQQTGGGQGPGMSLLQDSVLGMQPNAFQHADMDSLVVGSLAPGPGEFPSISELDQSLCLPSFPSHSHGGGGGTMPSIGEELEDDDTTCSLALSSQGSNTDLDPLTDSLVELGFDFSDAGAGGHRSNMTGQQRHHLQRQAQPSPLATTSARAHAQSSRGSGLGYSQGFQPPPTYQSAIDGSDGGFTTAGGGGGEGRDGYEWPIIDPPMPLGGRTSGSGPKSSSTPLIREGMRLRRGAGQTTTTSATQQQQPSSSAQQQSGANQEAANLNGLLQELDTL